MGRQTESLTEEVERAVDAVCALGCDLVRANISALQKGEVRTEYAALDTGQRERLLQELQSIMSVYEDRC